MEFEYRAHETCGLRLNANESSLTPSSEVMETFQSLLACAELNRYPDDDAIELRQAFAQYYGLNPEQVIAGNGSDALLQLMITAFCRDGKTLVMLSPDFGMYRFYTGCIQSQTAEFATDWNGEFDDDAFVQFAKDHNAGLVLISNPNNPTGHLLSADRVRKLAKALDPVILAMDEAYMNFSDQSMLHEVDQIPNLIVTQTLSKAWGAAGMRCGFLYASKPIIEKLLPYKIVYSVSTLDQLAARAVLAHPQIMEENVKRISEEKKRIQKEIEAIGAYELGEMAANFYSLRMPEGGLSALEQAFAENGIVIRDYPDHSRIRITIGLPEENDRVLDVLKEFAQKGGEAHA